MCRGGVFGGWFLGYGVYYLLFCWFDYFEGLFGFMVFYYDWVGWFYF
jgi:hypothetical protein